MRRRRRYAALLVLLLLLGVGLWFWRGRGPNIPSTLPPLYPVHVIVMRPNGAITGEGMVIAIPAANYGWYDVSGISGKDGTFELTTHMTNAPNDQRKPGAPAGEYHVFYRHERNDDAPRVEFLQKDKLETVSPDSKNEWRLMVADPPDKKK